MENHAELGRLGDALHAVLPFADDADLREIATTWSAATNVPCSELEGILERFRESGDRVAFIAEFMIASLGLSKGRIALEFNDGDLVAIEVGTEAGTEA